ncbi:cytochrome P450 [Mycena rebaudengoi]|nr:cytochrome P450 [Mycena rebaudengoi]
MYFLQLFLSFAGTLGAYALFEVLKVVYREFTSPIQRLPGPNGGHWLYGKFKELTEDSTLEEQWAQQYGSVLKYNGFLGAARLQTTDTKALNHVLMNSYVYQKPDANRYTLGRIIGPGLFVVEEDVHKQQASCGNPAFGAPQVAELTPIFVETSMQLRDIWEGQIAQQGGIARVDVLSWLGKATLDMIGLTGKFCFNYHFNALTASPKSTPDELDKAFGAILRAGTNMTPIRILQAWIPFFRFIPTKLGKIIERSQLVMKRIGTELLRESKRQIAEGGSSQKERSRDLLSLLVRANAATDIPASQRLSDDDVLAQVPTFLVAGHETTSTAMTWALFALTQNTAAQTRLRDELLSVSTESPTMDDLNALPYLDCVVRETLRLHAPVPRTNRVAMQDDVVSLNTPFMDVNGTLHETLRIPKGQAITIPILAVNRDPAIWGPDAHQFIPERWESMAQTSNTIPGVWGQMLTFLGGPRNCIGYRFSLVQMKALLFTLVRAFEFELAVPAGDIGDKCMSNIVQRPVVKSEPDAGSQMPLLIKPYVSQ